MFEIKSDYSQIEAEFDRLDSMPTMEMQNDLDVVLTLGFAAASAAVHVDTGKLKASGKKKSKANKNDWVGEFSFPAKNTNGVSYGMYERERGLAHDFLAGVSSLVPLFKAALMKGLRK